MGKKSKATAQKTVAAPSDTAFSLFGGKGDTALDDVFGKSVGAFYVFCVTELIEKAAFAVEPSAPIKTAPTPIPAVQEHVQTVVSVPEKKSKKRARVEEPTAPAPASTVSSQAGPSRPRATAKPSPKVVNHKLAELEPGFGQEDEDDDEDEGELVHESLKASSSQPERDRGRKTTKYVPPGESAQDRDRRTIFIGNLPVDVAKVKAVEHQMRAHILSFCPTAKIESVRFRSVAFAAPTNGPVEEEDDKKRVKREKERAAAWRATQNVLDGDDKKAKEEVDSSKTFLDAKGKRKVAFIKKEFHSEHAGCNAYMVFAHPHPDRSANVAPILDPYEAATKALAADGSTFMDQVIRVDSVRLPSAVALESASNALAKRDAWLPSGTNPKLSVFVGGLDYAAKEQDVRVFFEELVKAERGPRETRYVSGVRIIRDKDTQLGKGFGYVHFADRESVDEVLALDAKKLKFAKKPLRLQSCKTLPSAALLKARAATVSATSASPANMAGSATSSTNRTPAGSATLPKGNPALGEKLAGLSKEERKVAKAADAERQARRMAKKKARHGMDKQETGAVKLDLSRAERAAGKRKAGQKTKKGRVKSEAAVAKMKGSRA